MQAMKSGEARGIGHVWIGTFRVKEVGGCFGWGDIGLRKLHALRQPQHTADFVALMRLEKFPCHKQEQKLQVETGTCGQRFEHSNVVMD